MMAWQRADSPYHTDYKKFLSIFPHRRQDCSSKTIFTVSANGNSQIERINSFFIVLQLLRYSNAKVCTERVFRMLINLGHINYIMRELLFQFIPSLVEIVPPHKLERGRCCLLYGQIWIPRKAPFTRNYVSSKHGTKSNSRCQTLKEKIPPPSICESETRGIWKVSST